MKTVTINLYSFDELSMDAESKAINDSLDFLRNSDEVDDTNYEHTTEDAIEHILINEYFFFQDGTIAPCTAYTGKHEKAGITEFHFHGETIPI